MKQLFSFGLIFFLWHSSYGLEILKPYKNQLDAGITYFDRTTSNNGLMLHIGLSRTSKWNPIYYGVTFSGNYTTRYTDYQNFGQFKTTNINSVLALNFGARIAKKKRFSFTIGLSILRYYTSSKYSSDNPQLRSIIGDDYQYSTVKLSPYFRADYKINKKYSAFVSDQFFGLFDPKLFNFTNLGVSYNL